MANKKARETGSGPAGGVEDDAVRAPFIAPNQHAWGELIDIPPDEKPREHSIYKRQ